MYRTQVYLGEGKGVFAPSPPLSVLSLYPFQYNKIPYIKCHQCSPLRFMSTVKYTSAVVYDFLHELFMIFFHSFFYATYHYCSPSISHRSTSQQLHGGSISQSSVMASSVVLTYQ